MKEHRAVSEGGSRTLDHMSFRLPSKMENGFVEAPVWILRHMVALLLLTGHVSRTLMFVPVYCMCTVHVSRTLRYLYSVQATDHELIFCRFHLGISIDLTLS